MAAVKTSDEYKSLRGIQRAAILVLSLGEEHIEKIFSLLDEEEIRDLSQAMSNLGTVTADLVEKLCLDFTDQLFSSSTLSGSLETTERLLRKVMGDRASVIMEEIRGPAGRTMWDKLGNVSEDVLASYLKNEYPQTVAVVLSKIRPDHSAKVLALLPENFALEVISRMLRMENVQREILEDVEKTLRTEFMTNLARSSKQDAYMLVATIFNSLDRVSEKRFLEALENRNQEAAEKIKALMFTFDDLIRVDGAGIQTVIRNIDKSKLALALRGASEDLKELFLKNMSERAAKILKDDMVNMGPVRMKDVDEAQTSIVNVAKELSDKGEIILSAGKEEDEFIY